MTLIPARANVLLPRWTMPGSSSPGVPTASQPVTVFLAGGTYYLADTLIFRGRRLWHEGRPHNLCRVARSDTRDQRRSKTKAFLVHPTKTASCRRPSRPA